MYCPLEKGKKEKEKEISEKWELLHTKQKVKLITISMARATEHIIEMLGALSDQKSKYEKFSSKDCGIWSW